MKKLQVIISMALICGVSIAPSIGYSNDANTYANSCLESPVKDVAATALACATALKLYSSAEQQVPADVANRIERLKKGGELHGELRSTIIDKMRLNRRAFQSQRVLDRYAETRELLTDYTQTFEQCGLPRDENGHPLPQYPASFSDADHGVRGHYKESKGVVGCLKTKSGLAGVRAEPLAQHYYCTFPGNSPEIRSCFTFQIRVSSNTRSNSHHNILVTDEENDEIEELDLVGKEWVFAGTQQDYEQAKETKIIPQNIISKVATYCSVDGRAARAKDFTVDPPITYWHTEFIENYLQEVDSHQDPANTNESLITDYLAEKTAAQDSGVELLDIGEIDPVRDQDSQIKPPLCWINATQLSLFQLMLSPALTMYFDRNDQLSIIREYYQCEDSSVTQAYEKIKKRMHHYCPENFDSWDD